MMAKRKKPSASHNDTKVAVIITGLFAAAVILFLVFSKGAQTQHARPAPHRTVIYKKHKLHAQEAHPTAEGVDAYLPNETAKPVEYVPPFSPIIQESFKNLPGWGGKIAIIIDDWGQSTVNCKYLKEIPEPLAISILPGLRHTKDVAKCAKLNHKLTMLHLPLEALHNFDFYPPNYVIKTSMDAALVSKIIDDDMAQLPAIEGVNNHMGSKATEDTALMRIIFGKIRKKGLFFVDSMTAHGSVCAPLADEMGLAFGKRDVFLDNVNTREAIIRQIMSLVQKARHRGYAVAIGHDRRLTMQVLKEVLPELESHGIQVVSIKTLLKK